MLSKITTLIQKFGHLHHLIGRGKTGRAEKIAEKTNISHRTFFETLEELREQGIPIEYCKLTDSYEFRGDVKFLFEVTVDGEKIIHIKGGRKITTNFFC
jgi:hypothetical protein